MTAADVHDAWAAWMLERDGLHFLTGSGSCVKDAYSTSTGARYIEIACIIKGSETSSVIVGATTPAAWARMSPVLERAISGFRT